MVKSLSCCFLIFSLTLLGYIPASAQDECELTLSRAVEEFNAGHHYGIPSMLGPCLEKNQNKEWRQRAYLLLAETYLLLEDPFGAEKSYLEVLRANPEFLTDEKRDPIDLVYLSSKFTSTSIFTLSARVGPNVSFVRTLVDRGTYSDDVKKSNILKPGFQVGVGVDWNYDDHLSVMLEGNFVFSAYRQRVTGMFGRDELSVFDRQTWVRLPIAVKYSASKGQYRPYGYIGFSWDLLLGDRATIQYKDQNYNPETERVESIDRESPILKFKSKRNAFNHSIFIGGGVKYKVKLDYIFADLRYSFGMTNLVNDKNSIYDYKNQTDGTSEGFQDSGDGAFRWAHIDDLFRMDNLFISVGYIHPLYKPRKLKKAHSRSVLRSIKKQGDEIKVD
ncbi:MAG TPA: porin family protein [Ohtaekwangia sp.]|uniref:porin family protein n=1 Tax=Ohtaekwangia sp. TaxID=2066019 RepID=UPI002F949DFF